MKRTKSQTNQSFYNNSYICSMKDKKKIPKKEQKTARLYRRKNSRVKKALSFETPNNTKLA